MSEFLLGSGGALLLGALLFVFIRVAATIGPVCKCGHHRSVHRLPDTGCVGMWRTGTNAVGAPQWESCPCRSYRPTAVSYRQRVQHGTEERKW